MSVQTILHAASRNSLQDSFIFHFN